ncbi:hypothetical protein [Mycobacterium talmoniae]|uniref:Uncharacterized protein n=1 Tax=Mycobacterium talmoniae TaxID=1858794 RepID=A0A1S1NKN7_9MYCO|nr:MULTISPECIES: hypothetical protein [Mycobacterium]OHV04666.1 hypothetical protein BKN37_08835 [Mycobacterium talmoniae]TDH49302.1 hypothetical protein E2F47_21065 [Mycobacterium eburneum]
MALVDPRDIALMRRHNLEEQELSKQFLALHPHLDVYEADPWSYEDKKAEKEFFGEARARWLREGRELGARIDAENAESAAELTEIDVVGAPGQELVARYNDWRQRWSDVAGKQEWRPPEVTGDRLWFCGGYARPDWAGYLLYKAPAGYVVSWVTAERQAIPSTVVEAIFSRSDDAGKYIIARIGDFLRMKTGVTRLAQSWQSEGMDSRLIHGEASDEVVGYIARCNGLSTDAVRQSVRRFSVRSDPTVHADMAPTGKEFSRVLLLSYDDLDARLSEGMLTAGQVGPGYWLTVPETEEEPKLLIRSTDGKAVEGYAVSSSRWEPMPYTATPALNDPALWQPVAAEDVSDVQAQLHLLWDHKQQAAFDAKAPELVSPELTESAVRDGIVFYTVEILKRMPDGLVIGFQAPGLPPLSCSSGPVGPKGAWNFQSRYWVWGYPEGANDQIFDAFKRLFDGWDWTYRYEEFQRDDRSVDAWTDKNKKYAYHVTVNRQPHGGVSMTWTSPYYPGKYADREGGLRMPSEITKDGIRSWKPPVYKR